MTRVCFAIAGLAALVSAALGAGCSKSTMLIGEDASLPDGGQPEDSGTVFDGGAAMDEGGVEDASTLDADWDAGFPEEDATLPPPVRPDPLVDRCFEGAYGADMVPVPGGGVAIAGSVRSARFGDHELVASGTSDAFVARLDASGDASWARAFGGSESDVATALGRTPSGDIVVTGTFRGAMDLGDLSAEDAGSGDIFLAELADDDGAVAWARAYGGPGWDVVNDLDVDSATGAIAIAGSFAATLPLGERALTPIADGDRDAFVARLNPSGEPTFALGLGGRGTDQWFGVALHDESTALVGSLYNGTFDTEGEHIDHSVEGLAALFHHGEETTRRWFRAFPTNDEIAEVAWADGYYVTGTYSQNGTLGIGPLGERSSGQFVARLTSDRGTILWAHGFPTHNYRPSIAVMPDGGVMMVGMFSGPVDFGGGPVSRLDPTFADAYVVRLSPDGLHQESYALGVTTPLSEVRAALDEDGTVWLLVGRTRDEDCTGIRLLKLPLG